ncbi:ankyrin repeat domain-containing protein [Leptospira kirschneri]
MTLLHYACHHGDLDMIQTLLVQGAIQMSKSRKMPVFLRLG